MVIKSCRLSLCLLRLVDLIVVREVYCLRFIVLYGLWLKGGLGELWSELWNEFWSEFWSELKGWSNGKIAAVNNMGSTTHVQVIQLRTQMAVVLLELQHPSLEGLVASLGFL